MFRSQNNIRTAKNRIRPRRKNKNNPLIIGEAGVGKKALVESLAQAIVENKCSDFLIMKNIEIYLEQ